MAWSMPSKRFPSFLLCLIGAVAVAFVFFSYSTFPSSVPAAAPRQTHPDLDDIRNETLGVSGSLHHGVNSLKDQMAVRENFRDQPALQTR